ncbi:MAG: OmpH family outer membrane protein [Saprospiraceae bacterium]|nr:OmpH family outer membrane protein [Saprospiraceae bacterium]
MQRIKTLCLTLFFGLLTIGALQAQRIAIVDIDEVLESMDEYQQAQQELDRIAAEWRQEIQKEYDKIRSMYNKYQAEQVLLSDQARADREDEIMEMEQQVRELQKQRFGPEGGLFQKRQDLIRPIQDQVFGAIQQYAEDRGYDFIFDKGGSSGLIFSNEEYDKTDDIKRKLGVN